MAASSELPLASEFPSPSREDWMELVEAGLKGATFERRLVHTTYDGLAVAPLYTAADVPADNTGVPGSAPFTRGAVAGRVGEHGAGTWDIRQHHGGEDPAAVNNAILTDLTRGVTSISLGPVGSNSPKDLAAALDGVHLDLAPICLDWGADTAVGAAALRALWSDRGVDASAALAEFGFDPLGNAATSGGQARLDEAIRVAVEVANAAMPGVRALRVDATAYAHAGAAEAQEVACALATGVAYLRALVAAGLDVDGALGQLVFRVTAGTDQFLTMAKLRALRQCWGRVGTASGSTPRGAPMFVHAATSLAQYSTRDRLVNPLRATLACFAAAVGGADAITVAPMGAAAGVFDEAGRRLARNTQLMLSEESNLGRVLDPGGGSWYIESLTTDLAAEAWRRFQQIEASGGMAAALADGSVAAEIDATWHARLGRLATRKDPLTGVSEFPFLDEEPASGTASEPALGAFPLRRWAAPFEALRDAADLAAAPPTVFLANLGPVAVHTARAGFASNLFEVGGIRPVTNDGFDDAGQAAAAFGASGCTIAAICSSDAVYAEQAEDAARALKAAGAAVVLLAGNPGDQRTAYEAAGIDGFIHVGSNVLDTLIRVHDALGLGTQHMGAS